jgi:nucleotide-binding universal stress UspA family protein
MKAVMAVVDHAVSRPFIIEAACLLARDRGSRLEVVLPYPALWERSLEAISQEAPNFQIQQEIRAAVRFEEEDIGRLFSCFTEACEACEIPIVPVDQRDRRGTASWAFVKGDRREREFLRRARYSDLILLERPSVDSSEFYAGTVNTLLRETGRPVLFLAHVPKSGNFRRIAIAWNESLESSRAVASSLPLIKEADTVDILTGASQRTHGEGAQSLRDYLVCHGVSARPHRLSAKGHDSVGEAILEKCGELSSDLLIMGAYTHSRFRELVFGGVTRHVLGHAELPVLVAH